MMRKDTWPEDLNDYFRAPPAFAWGSADCCLWCADWILKITGADLGTAFRGTYASDEDAYARLRAAGFADVDDLAGSVLPPVAVALARRGDIVCGMFAGRKTLGICSGAQSAFLRLDGLEWIPTMDCVAAWRVG